MSHFTSKRNYLKFFQSLGVFGIVGLPKISGANIATDFKLIQLEFENRSYTDILKKIEERTGKLMIVHQDIVITAPDIADTGAFVSMGIDLQALQDDSIEWLALLSEKNPYPFIGIFHLSPMVIPLIETTVKMAETGLLTAVVFSSKKGLLVNHRSVQVVIGGCA